MRLMAGRRLAFRTNSALFKDTWVRSWNISELTNATGQQRKENGQLRVTLILFEKKSAKLHLPLNRSFCKRPEHSNVKWRSRQDTQVMALSRLSPTDVLPSSFLHPSIVQTHYCDGSRNTLFSRNHEECSSLCESTGSIFVSLECQHHVSEPFFAPSVKHLSHLVLSSGHVSSERLPLSIVFWRVDTDNNALVSCTRAYIHHVYQARRQKR